MFGARSSCPDAIARIIGTNRVPPPVRRRKAATEPGPDLVDLPTRIPNVEFLPIRLCPDPEPTPPPPADDGEQATTETRRESRANAVRRGLRAKLLFPLELMDSINELTEDFAIQLNAHIRLERWCAQEMARSTVQCDECSDQLLINKTRIIEHVGRFFDEDNAERADQLAADLATDPYNVQRALSRSKQGALLLIQKLSLLADVVQTSGGIDDEQRHVLFDLMGIERVYRNGSSVVPPGNDAAGLKRVITGEIDRHRGNLTRTLNDRSESEKATAQLGIVRERDKETKALRSDQTRARRRFSWALETLQMLKRGADPSSIIDYETGKPVAAGPPPSAVPDRSSSTSTPPPPPPPPPPPAPPAPPSPPLRPLPPGCPDELKDMLLVAAGTILPPAATPRGDEAGPPPPA